MTKEQLASYYADTLEYKPMTDARIRCIIHFKAGYDYGYQAAKAEGWIRTSERLPEFDSLVICFCPIWGRYIGSYDRIADTNFGNWSDYKETGILPPTHWQPLPQPPQTK